MGPELSAYSDSLDERVDTLLFGRPVWQMMVGFWPAAETMSQDPHVLRFAPFWRATPKIVFSRTLSEADWNTRVVGGDLLEEVTALKQQPGKDLLLTGGVSLAGALTAGAFSLWVIQKLFRSMLRLQSSGTVSLYAAVGSEGSVYLTVGKDGGSVQINFANRLREFEAVSADGAILPTGTAIRVQGVSANTLVVARAS
jgi:dihydrofolate reductase